MALGATCVALALAGCGSLTTPQTTAEAKPPVASGAPVERPSAASDQTRLNEQVSRIASELGELQNGVAKLIASVRQQDDQLTYLRRRVEELESVNRSRLPAPPPSGFAPAPPTTPQTAVPPTPLPSTTTTSADDLYRAGSEKLRAKDLDAAMLSFYNLVVTYPNHPLRESAQFLVADILYTEKDVKGALAEFEALISAVPRGEKVPEALVKIGLCQKDLGEAERAKQTWQRVVRDYPASVAARQARVLLKN